MGGYAVIVIAAFQAAVLYWPLWLGLILAQLGMWFLEHGLANQWLPAWLMLGSFLWAWRWLVLAALR